MAGCAIGSLATVAAGASSRGREARLSLHLADGLLARTAGGRTQEGQALLRLAGRTGPGLLGTVAAHAAVMRLTEIDDIHRPTAVTVGAMTVPPALAFAGADTRPGELLDALHAGQEVALRLALAAGGARLLTRGQWPSLIVAPLAAATVCARLLRLPPERMRHAMALAIAQVTRGPGRPLGARTGRWWLFGEAVRGGCGAALAAADGIDGDPGLLDGGWLQAIGGELAAPAQLTATDSLSDELSIKPHPSAKQALAAVHGLRTLLAEERIAPEGVTAVELHVPPAYAGMLAREAPQASRLASLVNAGWQLALAALRPELLDDVAREGWPDDPRLAAFADRVRVQADPSLDALYPRAYPARLLVEADGRRHERLVTDSPGDPALAFDAGQLHDKALRLLGPHTPFHAFEAALRLPQEPEAVATLRAAFGYAPGDRLP
ncbi:MmgE/PrpD family protein [Ramlibacter sp. AW1]|uniref:MmgE/PrpD family protein n=1 Tax=Ramlibacter aurantiacus TaxID=2801330 RepID=A0A936ZKS5_9BURK|nr:MmgE/PrpD family protein [Ramlibacter aurantiacus]MBL0422697.1 MmgE/PrpD family protein [Ramlibacter aurantiacus]